MHTMRLFAHEGPFRIAAPLDLQVQARGEFSATALEVADGSNSRPWHLAAEQLIERFVVDNPYVPGTAQRIFDPSELPPVLERVAMQAQHCSQTWFAWTDGPRMWFVVTEMATVTVRRRKQIALRMFFYDDEGRFVSWGTWALHPGGWMLCER